MKTFFGWIHFSKWIVAISCALGLFILGLVKPADWKMHVEVIKRESNKWYPTELSHMQLWFQAGPVLGCVSIPTGPSYNVRSKH